MKTKILLTAIVLCAFALVPLSQAQDFVGLGGGGLSLTTFGASGMSSAPVSITGLSSGDTIIDIDFHPATQRLFGMGSSGTLYTLTLGGVATINSGPVYGPGPTTSLGTPTAIDFNPMANRLRVFSGTANFRITQDLNNLSDDGTLTYVAGDPQAGMTPNLVAAAYIFPDTDAATGTTLYSIDATFNTLVVHSGGPQFSMLTTQDTLTLGMAVIDFLATNTGFDVFVSGGINTAFVSNGDTIYTVTLNMGMPGPAAGDLTLFTTVTGAGAGITDFAVVVPEPSTYALLAVGLAFGLFMCRRSRARA